MSEFDDIEGGEEAAEPSPTGGGTQSSMVGGVVTTGCLACSAPTVGQFCANCGQKHDDMRRNVLLLGRDFVEDTFSFDSRMWRTLGLLAVSPGAVPKDYAHGKRSRFTPPVRLFLVVSFLFFLVVGLTNTLFIGTEVEFKNAAENGAAVAEDNDPSVQTVDVRQIPDCSFQAKLRFFVKESDLRTDKEKLDRCIAAVSESAVAQAEESENAQVGETGEAKQEIEEAAAIIERVFAGIEWVVTNPREFNSAFNNWLTRMMFFMTPVLALILALFIRGKDALIFDHMVLSLYTHAVSFVIIGAALILAQAGVPYTGYIASVGVAAYYLVALKRGYGRGWIKTVWTALMSGLLYLGVLLTVVMTIVSNIAWQAAG